MSIDFKLLIMKNLIVIFIIINVFSCSIQRNEIIMDSLFTHKENFIASLEGIEINEIGKSLYEDKTGRIYTWAFGREKYVTYENLEAYEKFKGKIIYFSIGAVSSSFLILKNDDIEKILNEYETVRVAKKFNDYETAYYLSNGEIILFDNNKITGWLFKNIDEMNLILS